MNAAALLPLPLGERAGVRGHAGAEATSKHASTNTTASTHPLTSILSPRGEEAKA
jgi:UPF0176 protein